MAGHLKPDRSVTCAAQDVCSGCEHAGDGSIDELRRLRLRRAVANGARRSQARRRCGDHGSLFAGAGAHAGPVRYPNQARVCVTMSPSAATSLASQEATEQIWEAWYGRIGYHPETTMSTGMIVPVRPVTP